MPPDPPAGPHVDRPIASTPAPLELDGLICHGELAPEASGPGTPRLRLPPPRVRLSIEGVRPRQGPTSLDVYLGLPDDADDHELSSGSQGFVGRVSLYGGHRSSGTEGVPGFHFVLDITEWWGRFLEAGGAALPLRVSLTAARGKPTRVSVGRIRLLVG